MTSRRERQPQMDSPQGPCFHPRPTHCACNLTCPSQLLTTTVSCKLTSVSLVWWALCLRGSQVRVRSSATASCFRASATQIPDAAVLRLPNTSQYQSRSIGPRTTTHVPSQEPTATAARNVSGTGSDVSRRHPPVALRSPLGRPARLGWETAALSECNRCKVVVDDSFSSIEQAAFPCCALRHRAARPAARPAVSRVGPRPVSPPRPLLCSDTLLALAPARTRRPRPSAAAPTAQ